MKFIILGLFGLTISAASLSDRWQGSVECDTNSKDALKYGASNLVTTCLVYENDDRTHPLIEARDYYNAEIGNISGYTYDTTTYMSIKGVNSVSGGIAGVLRYDATIGRSYSRFKIEWLMGSTQLPLADSFVNRVSVRDKAGCVAHIAEYTDLSAFDIRRMPQCKEIGVRN